MTPEEQAAADAAAKTPEQLAADKAAADKLEADKKAGSPPALNADGTPKVDQVDKDGKPIVGSEGNVEEKAPDKYDLKLAEGSKLGTADVSFIEKVAREHNLSNESAQKLIDQQEVLNGEQSAGWLAELTADKTYGGAKLEETQRLANATVNKLWPKGTPIGEKVREWLGRGNGNNLVVAAMLADVGRATLEDSVIRGEAGDGGAPPKTAAEHLYGDTPKSGS